MEERALSSIIVVLMVVVVIELVAVAAIGVYYLRSGKSSTGGFADMDVSISPGSQSGATGAKLTYIVTVTNIGNVSDTYSLGVDWGNLSYKISPSILSIKAGDSENATLTVTVGAVSEVMELYATNEAGITEDIIFRTNVTGKELYALTTIVNGEGSVALNPAGEQYGPPIPRPRGVSTVGYLTGTVVTATATPSWGSEFDNWSGDASGTATSVTMTMNSDKKITANFRPENKKGTVLSITPSSFYGGCSTHVLTATLTDADGNPLAGKVIVWSATPSIPGYAPVGVETLISPIENVTNSLGQASIAYWAPVVDSETTVTIVAEFAGDELYEGSRGVSIGTIVPWSPPPPP